MNIRRVVTGMDSKGKGVFVSDGPAPRAFDAKHWKGNAAALLWATSTESKRGGAPTDPTPSASWHPGAGGTTVMIVDLPPDATFAEPGFDGAAMGGEQVQLLPGLGERFAPDGMHQTETIDYAVVLDGQIALELDSGEKKVLEKGDVCVQGGPRHAWRNPTNRPTRMLFVLVGTR